MLAGPLKRGRDDVLKSPDRPNAHGEELDVDELVATDEGLGPRRSTRSRDFPSVCTTCSNSSTSSATNVHDGAVSTTGVFAPREVWVRTGVPTTGCGLHVATPRCGGVVDVKHFPATSGARLLLSPGVSGRLVPDSRASATTPEPSQWREEFSTVCGSSYGDRTG